MADGHVSVKEAKGLQKWLDDHIYLRGSYPYDEIDSVILSVLEDGVIDEEEQTMLRCFFEDFFQYSFSKRMKVESQRVKSGLPKEFTLPGVCAVSPEISFDGRVFTFTGVSVKGPRKGLVENVESRGGEFVSDVSSRTEFLVIGAGGNPCWAFSCYGRKVEKAVNFRKKGGNIIIVHESDFWDAVEDHEI